MSIKPRIAHVMSPKTWRGGEQQAVNLFEELRQLGYYQIIVCVKGSRTESYCIQNQLNHVAIKKRLSLDLRFAKVLSIVCRDEQIDIMHPHDSGAHTFCILSADLFRNKANIVLHRRVDFRISRSFFSRYKYNHPRVKKIICVSNAIREIMRPDIRNKAVLCVVYSGIDVDKFKLPPTNKLRREFNIEEGRTIIANVAAISQQKDYFTFIDTVALLLSEGINAAYLAIGEGPQERIIKDYAKEKGVFDQIIFTGFRTDINEILPEIDLLLFTSETEGLGTTVIDCFAANVPVVSTNAGGIPELITHLENGYLAPVKEARQLAEGVKLALDNPSIAEGWVQSARGRVSAFSRQETARKTAAIYEAISEKMRFPSEYPRK